MYFLPWIMANSVHTSIDHDSNYLHSGVHFVYAHCPISNTLQEHVQWLPECEEHSCKETKEKKKINSLVKIEECDSL